MRGEVWFLDQLLRSYPLEDRGRILEYLYAGEEGAYAQAFHENPIRDKAQYLCAVIRACFPAAPVRTGSLGNPGGPCPLFPVSGGGYDLSAPGKRVKFTKCSRITRGSMVQYD